MPSIESIANFITGTRVGPVQRSVTKYGGHCTFEFTQCKPPVSTTLAANAETSGGVCEALSAHWIRYHAIEQSLWNWLIVDGAVDLAKLQQHVMALQISGQNADNQDAASEAWLRQQGVLRIQQNSTAASSTHRRLGFIQHQGLHLGASQAGTTSFFARNDLARAILQDTTGGAGCYKKLGLTGKAGAHAMAFWVAQDVVFFDPNFGEFYFKERAGFYNWFTQSFWHRSLYSAGLSGSYDLLPYAASAKLTSRYWN